MTPYICIRRVLALSLIGLLLASASTMYLIKSEAGESAARNWMKSYRDRPGLTGGIGLGYPNQSRRAGYWIMNEHIDEAVKIGYPVVPYLLTMLRSDNPAERVHAHIALERIRHPQLRSGFLTTQEEVLLSNYDGSEPDADKREAAAKEWDDWWCQVSQK